MKFVKEQCGNDDIEYIFYINYKSIVKCFNKRFRVFSFKLDPRGFDWTEEVSITKSRGSAINYNNQVNCYMVGQRPIYKQVYMELINTERVTPLA